MDCWEKTHHRMLHTFREERITGYLEITEYSEQLKEIVNDKKNGGIEICKDIFLFINSTKKSAELRRQVTRYLEFYPTYPGLLMLRSLSEAFSQDGRNIIIKQNFNASISSIVNEYHISENIIFKFVNWAIYDLYKRDSKVAKELSEELLIMYPSRDLARMLVKKLPIELKSLSAWFIMNMLQKKCDKLII